MSSTRYWHEEKFSERKVSEMTNYAFVLDANNKQLTPTKVQQNIVRKLTQKNVKYFGNILKFTG